MVQSVFFTEVFVRTQNVLRIGSKSFVRIPESAPSGKKNSRRIGPRLGILGSSSRGRGIAVGQREEVEELAGHADGLDVVIIGQMRHSGFRVVSFRAAFFFVVTEVILRFFFSRVRFLGTDTV